MRWVVDPIDGTVNFLYGIPQYAVSVAAQRDGVTVAGAVLDVASGSVWSAERADDGSAASWRDGVPTAVRAPAPLAQRLVGTGFSYEARVRALQAEAVGRLLPQVRDIRRFGSCALDLCAVASGRLDGYVEEGTHLWDHAAGSLVAEGAGARWELDPRGGRWRPPGVCPGTRVRRALGDRRWPAGSRRRPTPCEAPVRGIATRRVLFTRHAPDRCSESGADGAQSGADDDDDE